MTQPPGKIIHREYRNKKLLEVTDHGDYRSLYFTSRYLQSRMSLSRPFDLVLTYTQFMLFPLLFGREFNRILIVGIGAGSMIRFLHHHFPHCKLDCVDNSEHVIQLAKGYFQLPRNHNLSIHCIDGYEYIEKCQHIYDLILLDAFNESGMAPELYTNQFFKHCKQAMADSGIFSCNLWSSKKKELHTIQHNLGEQFYTQLSLPVPDRGNLIAHCMNFPPPWKKICRRKKELISLSDKYNINFHQIVRVARQNNLSIAKIITNLFH